MASLVLEKPNAIATTLFHNLQTQLERLDIKSLHKGGFKFHQNTFWMDHGHAPDSPIENAIFDLVKFSCVQQIAGIEWWLNVSCINRSQYWLLEPHFDRSDITAKFESGHIVCPKKSSVFFLSSVPYGDLVIFDKRASDLKDKSKHDTKLEFVASEKNKYVIFDGDLLHGVIGRMWKPRANDQLRITLAINYWKTKPSAAYIHETSSHLSVLSNI